MATFNDLILFVNLAQKNRKYPENTAQGLKAALRLFEQELKEEERASLSLFKERFDHIYRSVFNNNMGKFTASSLEVYKRRLNKVINDYEKYGIDPTKMANWSPKAVIRTKRSVSVNGSRNTPKLEGADESVETTSIGSQRLEWPLGRPGAKFVAFIPSDVSEADIKKMKTLLDLVETKN